MTTSFQMRLFTLFCLLVSTPSSTPHVRAASITAVPSVTARYGAVAPPIVENRGQFDRRVRFAAPGAGVFFTAADVRMNLHRGERATSLWLTFVDAAPRDIAGGSAAGSTVTFIRHAATPLSMGAYRDVVYRSLWPGVDARVTSEPGGVKYEFIVQPGASPSAVRLRYEGADGVALTSDGGLTIATPVGPVMDRPPVTYQQINGRRVDITSRFAMHDGEIGFDIGRYDTTTPLVIDPTIVYSTYLGSSGADVGTAVAVDPGGAAYVAGTTKYVDFPVTPGAYDTSFNGGSGPAGADAFVAKINAAGTHFDYVTYLGGSGNDEASGIAVDAAGHAYVTGYTESADFPTTAGAYRTAIGISNHDGFVTKLDATGSALMYSTFLGSNGSTNPAGIAVDAQGLAYVAGGTFATNLPSNNFAAWQTPNGKSDGFLMKLDAAGTSVLFGSAIGGFDDDRVRGIAVDGSGHAFVTGTTNSRYLTTTASAVQRHPNTAAFRSSDDGATWTPAGGPIYSRQVTAFAINPQDPSMIFGGSDEELLRSTDGGASWFDIDNGAFVGGSVRDLAINPNTPSTVLAATSAGTYRTLNFGAQWTLVASPTVRLVIAPSDTALAYATDGAGVLKSTDSGGTWTRVLSAYGIAVAVDPTNAAIVYFGGTAGDVWKSTNGGASWSTVILPPPSRPAVSALAVDPISPGTVFAGLAQYGVFKSTDGGATWTTQLSALNDPYRFVFDAAGGDTLYVSSAGAPVFAKTTDRGSTWQFHVVTGPSGVGVTGLAVRAGTVFAGSTAQSDAFAYKINTNAGTDYPFMYGTYLGGSGPDSAQGIAVDKSGNAYVVLNSSSIDLPITTAGGRTASAVLELNGDASAFLYGTYVGPNFPDQIGTGIAVDPNGAAYATGFFDDDSSHVFIDRLAADGLFTGRQVLYGSSSYVLPQTFASAIATDSNGAVYVTGNTNTRDFPVTPGAPQPSYGSGSSDAFITKVSFADASSPGPNVALNKTVVASSVFAPQYGGAFAVDGNLSTRWSSEFSDPQWIYVDLGQSYDVTRVVLRWETAYGADYLVQISNDASTWTTMRTVTNGVGGVDDLTGLSGSGRYVRMYGTRRGTQWGYSLWEFEVYGTATPGPNVALNKTVVASSVFAPQYRRRFRSGWKPLDALVE